MWAKRFTALLIDDFELQIKSILTMNVRSWLRRPSRRHWQSLNVPTSIRKFTIVDEKQIFADKSLNVSVGWSHLELSPKSKSVRFVNRVKIRANTFVLKLLCNLDSVSLIKTTRCVICFLKILLKRDLSKKMYFICKVLVIEKNILYLQKLALLILV